MAYVVAAYALVAVALVGYALYLWRERRGLRREIARESPGPQRDS